MTQQQEIICALALILWTVCMGNLHLEGKIARQERKYMDRMDVAIERIDAEVSRAQRLHEAYTKKTKVVFGYG